MSRYLLIESLYHLAKKIDAEGIPQKVIEAALAANPWFTAYYIRRSLREISKWFVPGDLETFVDAYSPPSNTSKTVGIIAAGNVPLVGFHDVLIALLCGHRVWLKCSHRDRELMEWLMGCWGEVFPSLDQHFRIVDELDRPDFLIATGSNNSSRYFEAKYQEIPRLVRKNRFSVAVIHQHMAENDWIGLCEDVLLYNGLGCRNVSNLLVPENVSLSKWLKILAKYEINRLNPYYLERVLREKAMIRTLDAPVLETDYVLLTSNNSLDYTSMGIVNIVRVKDESEMDTHVNLHRNKIQCVVGQDIKFGETQSPGLKDFADNVDTMRVLMHI